MLWSYSENSGGCDYTGRCLMSIFIETVVEMVKYYNFSVRISMKERAKRVVVWAMNTVFPDGMWQNSCE